MDTIKIVDTDKLSEAIKQTVMENLNIHSFKCVEKSDTLVKFQRDYSCYVLKEFLPNGVNTLMQIMSHVESNKNCLYFSSSRYTDTRTGQERIGCNISLSNFGPRKVSIADNLVVKGFDDKPSKAGKPMLTFTFTYTHSMPYTEQFKDVEVDKDYDIEYIINKEQLTPIAIAEHVAKESAGLNLDLMAGMNVTGE